MGLGRNWGHLGRQLPLARALRGGAVTGSISRSVTAATASLFLEAAGFDSPPGAPGHRQTHAGPCRKTLRACYGGGVMGSWRLECPGVRLAGHLRETPTRGGDRGFRTGRPDRRARLEATVGDPGPGVRTPSPTHPLPALQPWRSPYRTTRAGRECAPRYHQHCGGRSRIRTLLQLGQLFAGFEAILTTFPEFDHYSGRSRGTYVGPIYCAPEGAIEAHWPSGPGPRLLAYLGAQTRGLEAVTVALGTSGTTLACVPGWTPPDHIIQSSCRVYLRRCFWTTCSRRRMPL